MADNIAISDYSGASKIIRAIDIGGVLYPVHRTDNYDAAQLASKITADQTRLKDGFPGGSLSSAKWASVVGGGSIGVGAAQLTIGSGTTINDTVSVTSVQTFTLPCRLSVALSLSQRIINQNFYVELISVDATTGVPDGLNCLALNFNGTTATQAQYEVQFGGNARVTSSASTFVTTASTAIFELEGLIEDAKFSACTVNAVTARVASFNQHLQAPDPNAVYKLRLRWLNGGTAPASNTNAVISAVTCHSHSILPIEWADGRGGIQAAQAAPVAVANTPAVTLTSTTVAGTVANNAAGTPNPQLLAGMGASANPATGTTGRIQQLLATLLGVLIIKPFSIPEADWSYAALTGGTINTTDVAVKAAAGAGVRNYITGFSIQNASATVATEVVIKDGSTVIWRGYVGTSALLNSAVGINLSSPLKSTANTAINVACITTGAAVYVNMQGYVAP